MNTDSSKVEISKLEKPGKEEDEDVPSVETLDDLPDQKKQEYTPKKNKDTEDREKMNRSSGKQIEVVDTRKTDPQKDVKTQDESNQSIPPSPIDNDKGKLFKAVKKQMMINNFTIQNQSIENNIPPDWKLARDTVEKHDMMRKQEIGIFDYPQRLDFLGSGYPMYFNFFKFCGLLLVILFLLEGLPAMQTNVTGNYCWDSFEAYIKDHNEYLDGEEHRMLGLVEVPNRFTKPCFVDYLSEHSMANILDDPETLEWRIYLPISVCCVCIIMLSIHRNDQEKINLRCDVMNTTPADYTVMVTEIPNHLYESNKKLENALKNLFENIQLEDENKVAGVADVILVFDCVEYKEKQQLITKLLKQKKHRLGIDIKANTQDLERQMQKLELECDNLPKEYSEGEIKDHFSGTAFVAFNHESDKDEVLKQVHTGKWQLRIHRTEKMGESKINKEAMLLQTILVESAAEPQEIDWESIHLNKKARKKSYIIGFIKIFMLNAVSFGVILGITYWKSLKVELVSHALIHSSVDDNLDSLYAELDVASWISKILATAIVLYNKYLLPKFVHTIVDGERWPTKTDSNISFGFYLAFSLFFNSGIISFVCEVIILNNCYNVGGLMYGEWYLFLLNAIIPPVTFLVDPWYWCKLVWRKFQQGKEVCLLTQKEANSLCEKPHYSIGKRYADVTKTMWLTFLYGPLIPYAILVSLCSIIIYYWIDKNLVINRRTIHESIGKELSDKFNIYLEYSIALYAFGVFYFRFKFLDNQFEVIPLVIFIIAMLYIFVDWNKHNKVFYEEIHNYQDELCYKEAYKQFNTDYQRACPLYRNLGEKKHKVVKQKSDLMKKGKENSLNRSGSIRSQGSVCSDDEKDMNMKKVKTGGKGLTHEQIQFMVAGKNKTESKSHI